MWRIRKKSNEKLYENHIEIIYPKPFLNFEYKFLNHIWWESWESTLI